jgi:RimJ/RimL family protein N-acetyltransferase
MTPPLPPVPRLECGSVVVRQPTRDDAATIVAAMRDPLVRKHSGAPEWSLVRALEVIAAIPEDLNHGVHLWAAIADPATDAWIGSVGFHDFAWFDRRAELGFWLAAGARGHGYANAAVRGFLGWAVPVTGVARVDAFSDVDNPAAHAVLESAGFVREGELASYGHRDDGTRVAAYAFGLVVEG